jgi:hypothetical protein
MYRKQWHTALQRQGVFQICSGLLHTLFQFLSGLQAVNASWLVAKVAFIEGSLMPNNQQGCCMSLSLSFLISNEEIGWELHEFIVLR